MKINNLALQNEASRTREGAWIEITKRTYGIKQTISRTREGAWIEIFWLAF